MASSALTETDLTQTAGTKTTETASSDFQLCLVWVFPTPRIDPLTGASATLGRSSKNTFRLKGHQTSRHHANLKRVKAGWILSDAGSKNGLQVNSQSTVEHVLSEQDVVRIGDWVCIVAFQSPQQIQSQMTFVQLGKNVWGSSALAQAHTMLARASQSDLSVMLVGETGCGKDVFAKEIHRLSKRSGKFVSTNCATIPENMAEGELFGYRRGAFTGAERANVGHFRSAHQGTLFLDEIPDLNAKVQVKMLRALEEKSVVPLGQSHTEPADARVVCAAQLPLHDYVEQGKFRADLYSRLNGIEIRLPALRHRREEIVHHFLARLGGDAVKLSADFVEQLCVYDWPLNVREVIQLADRTQALHGDAEELGLRHLPEHIATFSPGNRISALPDDPASAPGDSSSPGKEPRDQLAEQFASALRNAGGNVSQAAKELGISRPMAYRLMKRLPELNPEAIRVASLVDPRQ